ncbi:MAG: Rmt family 16S rRNA (guanine(1405)-N(7))-methyltransferase [Clostridia bacterium]|nr:Rmt family 16S rRNA (guanine(1405)-N(7))-methyltransferase [Clostridia bacterium]MBQ6325124.1 Rmt family 16S rRNA (guanine(1405)-N(7))-methyltransferase [Clostridia bacterium]MBQ9040005.1 Rmt family 16S rRNA (guanine(1405)-N(7))-methyltransferase [Clostridia bacterium]
MSNELLDKLLRSKNYRDICPDTVRRVWAECEKRYKKAKDVDKAAREALHGISGAFMTPQEARQLAYDMQAWHIDKADPGLERMLTRHASTRERLPLSDMDATFRRIFAATGKPRSVLDLACGINPLYLGARGIETVGVDISGAAVYAVNCFHESYRMPVSARCADLLCPGAIPGERFDVALLFKLLPLLERQENGGAARIMNTVNARHIIVSFPTRTLGGRSVGMAGNYTRWMEAHLPKGMDISDQFETRNELYYIVAR